MCIELHLSGFWARNGKSYYGRTIIVDCINKYGLKEKEYGFLKEEAPYPEPIMPLFRPISVIPNRNLRAPREEVCGKDPSAVSGDTEEARRLGNSILTDCGNQSNFPTPGKDGAVFLDSSKKTSVVGGTNLELVPRGQAERGVVKKAGGREGSLKRSRVLCSSDEEEDAGEETDERKERKLTDLMLKFQAAGADYQDWAHRKSVGAPKMEDVFSSSPSTTSNSSKSSSTTSTSSQSSSTVSSSSQSSHSSLLNSASSPVTQTSPDVGMDDDKDGSEVDGDGEGESQKCRDVGIGEKGEEARCAGGFGGGAGGLLNVQRGRSKGKDHGRRLTNSGLGTGVDDKEKDPPPIRTYDLAKFLFHMQRVDKSRMYLDLYDTFDAHEVYPDVMRIVGMDGLVKMGVKTGHAARIVIELEKDERKANAEV